MKFVTHFVTNRKKKTLELFLIIQGFKRFRADSNRCRSFCRAQPSHSATEPYSINTSISSCRAHPDNNRGTRPRKPYSINTSISSCRDHPDNNRGTRPRNLIQSILQFPLAELTPITIGVLGHGTLFNQYLDSLFQSSPR